MKIIIIFLVSAINALKMSFETVDSNASNPMLQTSPWVLNNSSNPGSFQTLDEVTRRDEYQLKLLSQQYCLMLSKSAKRNGMNSIKNNTKTFKNSKTLKEVTISMKDCVRFNTSLRVGESRSDRQPSPDFSVNKKFTPINLQHEKLSTPQPALPNGFTLQFTCNVRNRTICAMANRAYISATLQISQSINLRHQVILDAKYMSFCTSHDDCSGKILGQASATSYWTLDSNPQQPSIDPNYWYPQALAKQLVAAGKEKAWAPTDITAEFNHDSSPNSKLPKSVNRFWFKESNVPILPSQYDFEYVILHEILHGMGFSSGWSTYIPGADADSYLPLVTPWYKFDDNNDGSVLVNGANPLTIFDKFIYSKVDNKALSESYFIMISDGLNKPKQSFTQWAQLFDSSPALTESRKLYYYATTPNTLEFRGAAGKTVLLHTEYSQFRPGSSLTHVDQSAYTKTSTFLMRPEANIGITLAQFDAVNTSPIDDKLLDVFETIGYTVNR